MRAQFHGHQALSGCMEGHVDAKGGNAVLLQDPGMPHKERLGGGHTKTGDHPNLVEQREAVEDAPTAPDRAQERPPGNLAVEAH
eukprot:3052788-Lingulodinium_polyedra.AAC.1